MMKRIKQILFYSFFIIVTVIPLGGELFKIQDTREVSELYLIPNWKNARTPSSVDSVLKSCRDAISGFFTTSKKKNNFNYLTVKLSDVQLNEFVRFNAGRKPLNEGDSIMVWNYDIMITGSLINDAVPQFVLKNGSFEEELLKFSNIDSKPREVMQVRIILKNGTEILSNKVFGNERFVSFSPIEKEVFKHIKENLRNIEKVEIAHTHPSYALTVTNEGTGQKHSRANQLSAEDAAFFVDFVKKIPGGCGVELSMTAIVPNGFHYKILLNR